MPAMSPLQERSLSDFADLIASTTPTPGGGSAAAYAGALGASLVAMVGRMALRHDLARERAVAELVEEADTLRRHFLRLVEDDSAAFERVAAAMRLPKAGAEGRSTRSQALQGALLGASRVPLETAKVARRLLDLCERVVDHATDAAVSDVGVGALFADAALRGAALNVMINIAALKDAGQVKELSEELDRAMEGTEAVRRGVIDRVEARIAH